MKCGGFIEALCLKILWRHYSRYEKQYGKGSLMGRSDGLYAKLQKERLEPVFRACGVKNGYFWDYFGDAK